MKKGKFRLLTWLSMLGLFVQSLLFTGNATFAATSTPDPTSVTIAGDLQQELGCSGD